MMADLVAGVARVLVLQGLSVDVRDGAEVPRQELESADSTGFPLPRIVFIENGLAGNLEDRYDGPTGAVTRPGQSTGASPAHLFVGFMTRNQGIECRVWGFDPSVDANGQTTGTPPSHRAAVNRLLHDTNACTGLFPALYAILGMANISWIPQRGHFDNSSPDIKFGALYVFSFILPIPVIARRVTVAQPPLSVAISGS